MTKTELASAVDTRIAITREALQTVYDALNKGQKQKIMKEEKIVSLFALYGVETEQGV